MSYEIVKPPWQHHCDLPDPKDFALGEIIRCTAYDAGEFCGLTWYRGQTWWWRDPVWRPHVVDMGW